MTLATPAGSLNEAYARCRAFTKARASNFYYAFSSLPKPKRQAIYATYAVAGTLDDIADDTAGDNRARRLAELRTLLDAAYAGQADDWLAVALADAVGRYHIPKPYFLDLIVGMEQDLTQRRYTTFAELEQYCYRAASVIGLICIEIFGYDRSRRDLAIAAAIDMGMALQLTNILRDLKEDAARDRIYLAQEDLARFHYREVDLFANVTNDAFRALMAEYARRARVHYARGERLIPLLNGPRSRMCCNGLQGVYRHILDDIERHAYDVFSERAGPSKAGRMLLLLRLWLSGAMPKASAT